MEAERRYVLAIHPLCPTSYRLVLDLERRGLLSGLELEVLYTPRPLGRAFPWSVPLLLTQEGEPIAMDPLDADEVESLMKGGYGRLEGDYAEQFAVSVLYSAYASSIALTHHSLEPMLDPGFLAPALRLRADAIESSGVLDRLRPLLRGLYEGERERIARALSVAVVRHLWYSGAGLGDLGGIDESVVGAIVLSMASVGRGFLPPRPGRPDMAGFMADFIRRRARGLLSKVEREHREITGDARYWRLIGERPGR